MARNKSILYFGVLALLLSAFQPIRAQVASDRYLVRFTDKDNTPYSVDQPEEFLSAEAIQRRTDQDIAIGVDDLPVDPQYIAGLQALGDLTVLHRLKWFNAVLIETTDPAVVAAIAEQPYVESLEISPTLRGVKHPTDVPGLPKNSEEEYGAALNQIAMLNGLPLHQAGYRGEGRVIAVLDGGFFGVLEAPVFTDLIADQRILATKNFVDPALDVYRWSLHGTFVLSTMAGYNPDTLIGTAPEASYVLCLTEDVSEERRIEEAWWAAAAEYADSLGADIINSSLGYSEFDEPEENYTYEDMDGNTTLITRAADKAASKGILVVASAGNSGTLPWHYITAPADGDSVLAVGAVTPDSLSADFSGRGPRPDGVIKPNVVAQGAPAAVAAVEGGAFFGNGTSFSSPIVAGMSAALWQAVPQATAWQVLEAIQSSAHLYQMPNDSMGYGIPDFAVALDLLEWITHTENVEHRRRALRVYPNPLEGGDLFIHVPASCSAVSTLYVYDVWGRLAHRTPVNGSAEAMRVDDLPDLKPDTYVLRLRCPQGGDYEGRLVVLPRR